MPMNTSRTGFARLQVTLAAIVFVSAFSARAELKVANIFGDNMVLQQQQAVPVWGWTDAGKTVTVSIERKHNSTRAKGDGKWLVKLDDLKASAEPQSLAIAVKDSGETQTFSNVLVGEVWLASGQSNMEKPIGHQPG